MANLKQLKEHMGGVLKELEDQRKNLLKNTNMFEENTDDLYVLTAKEIDEIIRDAAYLSVGEGKDLAKKLATPFNEAASECGYGYCDDCDERRRFP